MGFKKPRLGPLLLDAARAPGFFDQVHVIFGGTGAVGGSTAQHLISFFEEAAQRSPAGAAALAAGRAPRIVVTGRSRQEVRQFTSHLFGLQARDHRGGQPERLPGVGYRTVGGVVVEMQVFAVDPSIPELAGFARKGEAARRRAVAELLAAGGLAAAASAEEKAELLARAVRERVGAPFGDFLRRYRDQGPGLPPGQERFRSVVVGIPLASVATYKLEDLDEAGPYFDIDRGSPRMEALKDAYLQAICDDLAQVAGGLAGEVLAAHTTAVGGMYDEEADGSRTIRIGFAHTARGEKMRQKQLFAEHLAALYSARGIKMLVTAAAIGIDTVLVDKVPPLNGAVRAALTRAAAEGAEVVPAADLSAGVMRTYPPLDLRLLGEPHEPVAFSRGAPLVLGYTVKSGENGFFTVADAESLYRVMRVVSSSELGLLLARTAVFGDHTATPSFPGNLCYYTETDTGRQVFDLLRHPPLARSQLTGLDPKSLQDLGSAKHQAEMHTLGLLILLYRLKTLDLDAIPREVDLQRFDPVAFFESRSRVLTLERVAGWTAELLAADLVALATARQESDLGRFQRLFQTDPARQEAAHRVLQAVLRAVWAIPSLGSPILYETGGERRLVVGPYAAPIDRVVSHRDAIADDLRQRFEAAGGGGEAAFERFMEFHVANYGFVDLRPLAVLATARTAAEGFADKVQVFREEEPFIAALRALPPYSYFTTSGLLALLVRLRSLHRQAGELDPRLGSANEYRSHFVHDDRGRALLVPGLVEAARMVSEGLGKNTGSDRLDGRWGYGV
jgi:hypothetical protein